MFLRNVAQVVIINYENYKIICDLSTFCNKSLYKCHKSRNSVIHTCMGQIQKRRPFRHLVQWIFQIIHKRALSN